MNTKKHNILLIHESRQFSGVTKILFDIKDELKNRYNFSFLVYHNDIYNYIRKSNSNKDNSVFFIKANKSSKFYYIAIYRKTLSFFKRNTQCFDIIHINSGNIIFDYVIALAAKKGTRAKIIVHSHSAVVEKSFIKKIMKGIIKKKLFKTSDIQIACSKKAKDISFTGNNVETIPNGVNIKKYTHDYKGIPIQKKNLGFVGRLSPEKNPLFALEVLEKVIEMDKEYSLTFFGCGPLKNEILKRAKKCKIDTHVRIVEDETNPENIYSNISMLIIPSLNEGFGLVSVESQLYGIPVFASENVSNETNISNLFNPISLEKGSTYWAKKITEYVPPQYRIFNDMYDNIDITKMADNISKVYTELLYE